MGYFLQGLRLSLLSREKGSIIIHKTISSTTFIPLNPCAYASKLLQTLNPDFCCESSLETVTKAYRRSSPTIPRLSHFNELYSEPSDPSNRFEQLVPTRIGRTFLRIASPLVGHHTVKYGVQCTLYRVRHVSHKHEHHVNIEGNIEADTRQVHGDDTRRKVAHHEPQQRRHRRHDDTSRFRRSDSFLYHAVRVKQESLFFVTSTRSREYQSGYKRFMPRILRMMNVLFPKVS